MAALRRQEILIVEDSSHLAEVVKDFLEEEGFAVACESDGEAAMRHLARRRPDLVILDLGLPKTDGWAVYVWMKNEAALRDVPVLIMSGSPIPGGLRDRMNHDLPVWLEKPVDADAVLGAIRKHLAR